MDKKRSRGDRDPCFRLMPGHPVREDMDLSAWIAANPLPVGQWSDGARICISTETPRVWDRRDGTVYWSNGDMTRELPYLIDDPFPDND